MASKENLLKVFFDLKKERNLTYYDTHIHPVDVFGICADCSPENKQTKPSLVEYFEYHNGIIHTLKLFFKFFPKYIQGQIKIKFPHNEEKVVLNEMKDAHIDKSVIVPIYPHATPKEIYSHFHTNEFIRLGSIDIHNLKVSEIEEHIYNQIKEYSIVGIKLHPNIQGFYPEPSLNHLELKEKLEVLYKSLNKYKLYTLIHGGLSYIPEEKVFNKKEFGLIDNFFSKNGGTFLDTIGVPVIIAHLGLYNVTNPSFEKINLLSKKDHVYFDTAGVGPKLITKFIDQNGSHKLIFGSDAPYFDLKYNVYLVLKAISGSHADFQDAVAKIFSLNYKKVLGL